VIKKNETISIAAEGGDIRQPEGKKAIVPDSGAKCYYLKRGEIYSFLPKIWKASALR